MKIFGTLTLIVIALIFLYAGSGMHFIYESQPYQNKNPLYWTFGVSFAYMGAGILSALLLTSILPSHLMETISDTRTRI